MNFLPCRCLRLIFTVLPQNDFPAAIFIFCTVIAILGTVTSFYITPTPQGNAAMRFPLQIPFASYFIVLKALSPDRILMRSIVVKAFFWFLAALLQLVLVQFAQNTLHGDSRMVSLMQAAIALGIGGGGLGCFVLYKIGKIPAYMLERFKVIFDHDYDVLGKGWQQTRSLLAIGSGRLWGQGLYQGTQTQSAADSSLPKRHTDFFFSVAGEELGFFGCLLIIVLLFAIVLRCFLVSRRTQSSVSSYVCVGIAAMLMFQTIENIGMCLFVMPVIGLTLPFFSYGGSSIVTLYAAMGIVSSIKMHTAPERLRR